MKTDHLALLRSGAPLSTRQQISLTLQLSWPAIMAQLATIIMQYIDAAMVLSLIHISEPTRRS